MPGPISSLTGGDNYFEDFVVGAKYEHARGKTVTEMDGVLITNMVMNTAQGHFNEDQMAKGPMGQRIVFGGVTAAMVVGLALICHVGGQGLVTYALAYLPTAFSSLTLLLQPVVAAILAWVLLAEPVGPMQALGGAIVLAGILVARRG